MRESPNEKRKEGMLISNDGLLKQYLIYNENYGWRIYVSTINIKI